MRASALSMALWLTAMSWCGAVCAEDDEAEFRDNIRPLLARYCYDCHGDDSPEADLSLSSYGSPLAILEGRPLWLKAHGRIESKQMPPPDADQPTVEQRRAILTWIDRTLNAFDCVKYHRPGRVTLRRLNRFEYRNTIRELVGIDYEPADDFPADDVGYGFDHIGDVLSLPPILMEKYLSAAEQIVELAIVADAAPAEIQRVVPANELSGGNPRRDNERILSTNGEISFRESFSEGGLYEIRASAYADQAGGEPAKMSFRVDGRDVKDVPVKAVASRPITYRYRTRIKAGDRRIGVAFLNDYYLPKARNPSQRDRNLIIRQLEIRGPLDARPPSLPKSHEQIITVVPSDKISSEEAARRVLRRLASRAYRRPATDAEIERLVALTQLAIENDDPFEAGIQLALQAILVSPHFLFKIELDPPGSNEQRDLSDYELAARLSYFLWSSMPDDELFEHAWRGTLRRDGNLEKQVRRMLADSRSQHLVENFSGQWLQLRGLDDVSLDRESFPSCDDALLSLMRQETERFFASVMRNDESILRLLDGQYTFVNERLAKHYGLAGIKGDHFRRVSLKGTARAGILTHASLLTVTSNPNRTSPVKRGKFILENLLGTPPPPPPPNVPELEENAEELTGSLRQRMEQHRENPNCAACHQTMDPLGFALENFDAIGRWRTRDGKFDVDARGELPNGERIDGAAELRELLVVARREPFVTCFTEKMLTYALGRGLEYYDVCTVREIARQLSDDDYRFSTLILEIVRCDAFQIREAQRSGR